MPRHIVKLETTSGPRYLEYSTIVDAPVTYGLTRAEMLSYLHGRYGGQQKLVMADIRGTSEIGAADAWETMRCNRAGRDETCLSIAQIVDWYCDRRSEHGHDETDDMKPMGVPYAE